jgi:hypothetical protein
MPLKTSFKINALKIFIIIPLLSLCIISCSTKKEEIPPPKQTAPNAPDSLIAKVVSSSQVTLQWLDKATNEAGFKIERKEQAGNYIVINSVGPNVTFFEDKTVKNLINYTYRIYSYNSGSSSNTYSNEASAFVYFGIPLLTTNPIDSITASSAVGSIKINNDGGAAIIKKGLVWDVKTSPNVLNSNISDEGVNGFCKIGILESNTTYYVRSFATNANGTAYGNELTFKTENIDLNGGLLAFYPFLGNSNDSTINKNDQIPYKNPTYVEDRKLVKNSAIYFNGSNYTLSNNIFLNTSKDYAISLWFKSNTTQSATLLNTSPHTILAINLNYVKPNKLAYFIGDGYSGSWSVAVDQVIDYTLSSQKWYNLVINFSSNSTNVTKPNTWDFYIDGKLLNTFTSNKLPYSNFTRLGFGTAFVFGNIDYYIGALDDVRIYNKSLTMSQIEYIATH